MDKTILLGKDLLELSDICIKNDLPKFHGEQLYKWMYQKSTLDINDMFNNFVSKNLTNKASP